MLSCSQAVIAGLQRHLISITTWLNGLRSNPLAIAAVAISVATVRLVNEA